MRLLVTRPEPDGERTAERLRVRGCEVMLSPLLRIEPVMADLGEGWDAVALTSASAARALAGHPALAPLRGVPLYAVGGRSADAARTQGFARAISADGTADDLVRLMVSQCPAGSRVLYLAGEDRSADLGSALAAAGIDVQTRVVYRAVAASHFPADVRAALAAGTIDGVLHFSRRTAAIYVDCAARAELSESALAPVQYCLSGQVAEPLSTAGAQAIRLAERPTEAALVELVMG